MTKEELKSRTFLGIVEDNEDPKKLGRVKIRVASIYDNIPKEDIPFAVAWKDLNGNGFNIPDIGKVVSVVFDDGSIYNPQYIYADHYNINLENKLNQLSSKDYTSMKSVMFDHSTQIYRTESEGLKIDHEYSNVNLDKNGNICLNIRDESSIITLGSKDADENAVLGSTFMDWMDSLVDNLIGSNGGPYLGNMGAPVVTNPAMINCLNQYKSLREDFLSRSVKISKNGNIIPQSRPYLKQYGDGINSITETPDYTPSGNYQSEIGESNPATAVRKNDMGNEVVTSTESSGPPNVDKNSVSILWNCNIFNQGDPSWGNYGNNGLSIKKAGCCLATYAMVASAYGVKATPYDFYKASGNNVVTDWSRIAPKFPQITIPKWQTIRTQSDLDSILSKGPLLWESKNKKDRSSKGGKMAQYVHGRQHWMAIVGKNKDGTYIIYDPNGGKPRTAVPFEHIKHALGRIGSIPKSNASRDV